MAVEMGVAEVAEMEMAGEVGMEEEVKKVQVDLLEELEALEVADPLGLMAIVHGMVLVDVMVVMGEVEGMEETVEMDGLVLIIILLGMAQVVVVEVMEEEGVRGEGMEEEEGEE